jgi:hypothetical protein
LLNIDGDENSNSHGGRHTGRGVRLTVRQALLSWVRTVENEDSSFLARLLGVALAFA